MADRTSAALFGHMFEYLAKDTSEKAREFARHIWGLTADYDFNSYQMYCDEALEELGLATRVTGENGDRYLYEEKK